MEQIEDHCASVRQIKVARRVSAFRFRFVKRKKIPNALRFEVFKRDKFCCQYCGRKAPEIILQVDHLRAVSKGGGNEILNLVTSCFECNSGKSNKQLTETAILDKTRAQLEELEERRQQLEMMVQWKKSLTDAGDRLTEAIGSKIKQICGTATWLSRLERELESEPGKV